MSSTSFYKKNGMVYCCYCGEKILPPLFLTTEHLIPVSQGGNENKLNKAPCCNQCNQERKSMSYEEWILKLMPTKDTIVDRNTHFKISNIKMAMDFVNKNRKKLMYKKK